METEKITSTYKSIQAERNNQWVPGVDVIHDRYRQDILKRLQREMNHFLLKQKSEIIA